jgi:7-cyano-7-deazaguanine reductase
MSTYAHLPLGKKVAYPEHHDASLLATVPRQPQRAALGISEHCLPFHGEDIWTLYELSWLDVQRRPQVALGELRVDAQTPQLIESKSLKLYLNSFNQTCFRDWQQVMKQLQQDLSRCAGNPVAITLQPLRHFEQQPLAMLVGRCIDDQPSRLGFDDRQAPDPTLLKTLPQAARLEEQLVSHLFKSNCPVTGQPDWASLQIHYRGPQIDPGALLDYLLSFRCHSSFHEQCVEQIFCDLQAYCHCTQLSVLARYTRRGGIDINPFRSNWQAAPANQRLVRQ